MASIFQRAAAAIGRIFGRGQQAAPVVEDVGTQDTLIQPVRGLESENTVVAADDMNAMLTADRGETLEEAMTAALAEVAQDEAAEATRENRFEKLADTELAQAVVEIPALAQIPLAGVPIAPEATGDTSTDSEEVLERIQFVRPAAEMKPEPKPIPAPEPKPAKPTVSFTQLYDLISDEVNRRADTAIGVYERLLATSREEVAVTRKNTKMAWTIGGVMTAVAAVGTLWAAGEASGTKRAVVGLKSSMVTTADAAAERDRLRTELSRIKDTAAIETGALKTRLDQALTVSAERDRLRTELENTRRAKETAEAELKQVRTTAAASTTLAPATQPLSSARPSGAVQSTLLGDTRVDRAVPAGSGAKERAAASERQDRWSVLLNGQE